MSDVKSVNKEKNSLKKENLINIMADRLDDLIEDEKKCNKITNKQIAKEIEISESQLSKVLNAQTELGISSLVKIAKHFNVSTDYLLSLTNLKCPKEDFKTIHKVTGLLDESIKNLYSMNKKYDGTTYVLNLMLANPKFSVLLLEMMQYLLDMSNAGTGPYDDYKGYDTMSKQSMEIDIEKENNSYRIKNKKDLEYLHLFKITNILQNIAKEMKEEYLSKCDKT